MRSHLRRVLVTSGLMLGGIAPSAVATPEAAVPGVPALDALAPQSQTEPGPEEGWIVKKGDHVCGISDAKKISNPAKVDYQRCLEATPPWKELQDEGIDPESPQGKALRAKAVRMVAKAAEKVREAQAFCSVWKKVEHSDGRAVADASDDVIEEVEDEAV